MRGEIQVTEEELAGLKRRLAEAERVCGDWMRTRTEGGEPRLVLNLNTMEHEPKTVVNTGGWGGKEQGLRGAVVSLEGRIRAVRDRLRELRLAEPQGYRVQVNLLGSLTPDDREVTSAKWAMGLVDMVFGPYLRVRLATLTEVYGDGFTSRVGEVYVRRPAITFLSDT